MIMSHELCDGSSKVELADRYDPIETFLFDGSHEAYMTLDLRSLDRVALWIETQRAQ